jgi:RNA polymerase sigma-70 factor, ECF subfamily
LASTFSDLYQAHVIEVRRFALFLSGDPALADDITSETFIRLWHARERLDLATVKAYLLAIARNLFLEHHRRASRLGVLGEHPDRRPDPEEQAGARAELRAVLSALQALPDADRAAVLLRADEELSYEEIAAILGISPGAARVKVHRARLKLAEARLPLSRAPKGERP